MRVIRRLLREDVEPDGAQLPVFKVLVEKIQTLHNTSTCSVEQHRSRF
jgi:hypothetical protein